MIGCRRRRVFAAVSRIARRTRSLLGTACRPVASASAVLRAEFLRGGRNGIASARCRIGRARRRLRGVRRGGWDLGIATVVSSPVGRRRRTATIRHPHGANASRHRSPQPTPRDRHRVDLAQGDRYPGERLTGLIPAEVEGLVSSVRGRKPTRAVVRGRRILRPGYRSPLGSHVADLIRREPINAARAPRSRSRLGVAARSPGASHRSRRRWEQEPRSDRDGAPPQRPSALAPRVCPLASCRLARATSTAMHLG